MNVFKKYNVLFFNFLLLMILNNNLNSQVLFNLPKQDSSKKFQPVQYLQTDLEAILKSQEFSNAFIGISVVSLETGEVLFKKNEMKNFIPASNTKLLTTATALRYLGADYRFQTRMYINGEINPKGELEGDIYLRGYGDPTISDIFYENPNSVFNFFISKLDSLGITSINGNIIGDDNFFDDAFYAPGWQLEDLVFPYAAQINALSAFDNKLDIFVAQGDSVGAVTYIEINPDLDYISVVNESVTSISSSGNELHAIRDPNTNQIRVYGNIAYDSLFSVYEKISVTIENPTIYFLNLFNRALLKNDINLKGDLVDIDDLQELPVYSGMGDYFVLYSSKLSQIIKIINKQSHNLASEMLLKTIARETMGYGSTANGIEQEKKFLARIGIASGSLSIYDGSGLSRMNLISPKSITSLLSSMYKSDYRNEYLSSLAVPGDKGTLDRRMTKTYAEKKVKAKTGSMNNISTLSGYVFSREDEPMAFSIMIMNYTSPLSTAQNIEDLIVMRLATFSRYPENGNIPKE